MLGPSDGVNNRSCLLHVAIFANRSIEFRGFEELFPRYAGDAFDHLRGIPRVMLLQKLEDAIGVLQRWIELDPFGQLGSGSGISSNPRIIPRGLLVGLRLGVKAR